MNLNHKLTTPPQSPITDLDKSSILPRKNYKDSYMNTITENIELLNQSTEINLNIALKEIEIRKIMLRVSDLESKFY